MGVAGGLQCCVRRLPCSLFCLVLSCVQVKGEAHWGNHEKNQRWNDALEVVDGGKKFARPNIQEFLFVLWWVEEIVHHLYELTFANA